MSVVWRDAVCFLLTVKWLDQVPVVITAPVVETYWFGEPCRAVEVRLFTQLSMECHKQHVLCFSHVDSQYLSACRYPWKLCRLIPRRSCVSPAYWTVLSKDNLWWKLSGGGGFSSPVIYWFSHVNKKSGKNSQGKLFADHEMGTFASQLNAF